YQRGGKQEDIFIGRIDGTEVRQLTDDAYMDRGPRWSPDGKRIVFYSNRSGKYEIWTVRPDGSGLEQLSFISNAIPTEPLWSPDGKRLAFGILPQAGILILDAGRPWTGEAQSSIAPWGATGIHLVPSSWSPDGR